MIPSTLVGLLCLAAFGFQATPLVPRILVGITHTRFSADPWNDPGSVENAQDLLGSFAIQNQFIMGWGTQNPEPSPGVFDWSSLDERVNLMRQSGRPIVLTLCCAPDWMKGGAPGATDWTRIDEAPLPRYFGSFGALCASVARRYPEVHYFQVWSELRGFYSSTTDTWDISAYTQLYNQVYSAIKTVNPEAHVGGPYVPIDSWESAAAGGHPSDLRGPWGVVDARPLAALSYWLQHKTGADFISVDGGLSTRDGPPVAIDIAVKKLEAVDSWLAARTKLPIWWSELQVGSNTGLVNQAQTGSATVLALDALAASGAQVALLWCGERCGTDANGSGFWTRSDRPGGGLPTQAMQALLRDSRLAV